MKWFVPFFILLVFHSVNAQYLKSGKWRGVIHYSQQDVPFTFEISYPDGNTPLVVFINGKERREIENVTWDGDSIRIPISPFDIEIKAAFTATTMKGLCIKKYKDFSIDFSAEYGLPRLMKKNVQSSPSVEDRWAITFEKGSENEYNGVGLFQQVGETVYGTVMTKVSDFRYFEGIMDGDSIKLSSFDGVHAFMILGKKTNGKWYGEFVFDNGYNEQWIGVPDPEAALVDPFKMVEIEPGKHKPYYDLLGAGSGKDAIDVSKYEGKVLVIQLFGTWCPNSHDQTKYLVDWYHEHKPENVEILASSYEANYSREYGLRRINEYVMDNQIPYDVVVGGRLSKVSAAMPFPFMDRIEAFPTLVIIDKQGYVRYVHSYFNGPATGVYYAEFDQRFNEIITALTSE